LKVIPIGGVGGTKTSSGGGGTGTLTQSQKNTSQGNYLNANPDKTVEDWNALSDGDKIRWSRSDEVGETEEQFLTEEWIREYFGQARLTAAATAEIGKEVSRTEAFFSRKSTEVTNFINRLLQRIEKKRQLGQSDKDILEDLEKLIK